MELVSTKITCGRLLPRFSLITLLVLMSLVAGYLSGYQFGGKQRQLSDDGALITTKAYRVEDFMAAASNANPSSEPNANMASLVELIQSTVATDQWQPNGESEIAGSSESNLIVAKCSGKVHDEIAEQLQDLRERF